MTGCRHKAGAKKLRPARVYVVSAAVAAVHHCGFRWLASSGYCRRRKIPRAAATRSFLQGLWPASLEDAAGDRPFDGNRLANVADVSRMDEISFASLVIAQLLKERSASIDAPPVTRRPAKGFSNETQALWCATGNSACSGRK